MILGEFFLHPPPPPSSLLVLITRKGRAGNVEDMESSDEYEGCHNQQRDSRTTRHEFFVSSAILGPPLPNKYLTWGNNLPQSTLIAQKFIICRRSCRQTRRRRTEEAVQGYHLWKWREGGGVPYSLQFSVAFPSYQRNRSLVDLYQKEEVEGGGGMGEEGELRRVCKKFPKSLPLLILLFYNLKSLEFVIFIIEGSPISSPSPWIWRSAVQFLLLLPLNRQLSRRIFMREQKRNFFINWRSGKLGNLDGERKNTRGGFFIG